MVEGENQHILTSCLMITIHATACDFTYTHAYIYRHTQRDIFIHINNCSKNLEDKFILFIVP